MGQQIIGITGHRARITLQSLKQTLIPSVYTQWYMLMLPYQTIFLSYSRVAFCLRIALIYFFLAALSNSTSKILLLCLSPESISSGWRTETAPGTRAKRLFSAVDSFHRKRGRGRGQWIWFLLQEFINHKMLRITSIKNECMSPSRCFKPVWLSFIPGSQKNLPLAFC